MDEDRKQDRLLWAILTIVIHNHQEIQTMATKLDNFVNQITGVMAQGAVDTKALVDALKARLNDPNVADDPADDTKIQAILAQFSANHDATVQALSALSVPLPQPAPVPTTPGDVTPPTVTLPSAPTDTTGSGSAAPAGGAQSTPVAGAPGTSAVGNNLRAAQNVPGSNS